MMEKADERGKVQKWRHYERYGEIFGGLVVLWLGISLYLSQLYLRIGDVLGAFFFLGAIFMSGLGVLIIGMGFVRLFAYRKHDG